MTHKKIRVLLCTMALASLSYAQQPPQGTPGPGAFWRQGGNIGGLGAPNIFGTATNNNNPIYTITNGTIRTTLNGNNTSPNPNGLVGTINTTGFFGLNTTTPATRFHISGNNNVPLGGYRTWMRDGLMISNNSDNMYIGLWHPNPGNPNETDAIINWGDDDANAQGPDNLKYVFTSYLV